MCGECGCGDAELVPVDVHDRILSSNDRTAGHNRAHFREAGVLALNLMGSPGAGKTALLEATARAAKGRWRLGAVSGDLATDNDAQRLRAAGIPSGSITTGQGCHLDAQLVHDCLHGFDSSCCSHSIDNRANSRCVHIDRHRRHRRRPARTRASLTRCRPACGSACRLLVAPERENSNYQNRNYRKRSEKNLALRYPPRLSVESRVRHFIVSSD